MATVPAVRIENIESFAFGADTYKGIRSITVAIDKGRMVPILEEGKLYPTGVSNVGIPENPVNGQLVFETEGDVAADLLVAAPATAVITYKPVGAAASRILTISNMFFTRKNYAQNIQDPGRPTLDYSAFSSDGTSLPAVYTVAGG